MGVMEDLGIPYAAGYAAMMFAEEYRKVRPPYLLIVAASGEGRNEEHYSTICRPALPMDESLLMGQMIAQDVAESWCTQRLAAMPTEASYRGVAIAMKCATSIFKDTPGGLAQVDQLRAALKERKASSDGFSTTRAIIYIGGLGKPIGFAFPPESAHIEIVSELLAFERELNLLREINKRFMAVSQ